MKLRITTPLNTVVDEDGVQAIRAEDASGGFGVLPGHADFLTSLVVSVVSWTNRAGQRRHCAVRGGVFTVTGGREVEVATREAIRGDELATLQGTVVRHLHDEIEAERAERAEATRLQLAAIRQIMRHLRPDRTGGFV